MHARSATIAALCLTAALTAGCSSNDVATVSTHTGATAGEAITAETEKAPTKDPTDEALNLTDTATYESEIAVSLSGYTRAVSSEYASPGKASYLRFKVKVTNGSTKTLDMSLMAISCQYGDEGQDGEEIFDSENGLDGAPTTHLRPGRSITAVIGCELPKDETYMQIEVTPDFESETAIFAGDVKK